MKRLVDVLCEDDYDYTTWDYVSEVLLHVKATIALSIAIWFGFVPESHMPIALLAMAVLLSSLVAITVCAIRR